MSKQRSFSKRSATSLALLTSLIAMPSMAPAATLEKIRGSVEQPRTRLVFDMDESVYYTVFALTNPERIVIDFRDVDAARVSSQPFAVKPGALVESLRYATRGDGDLRVVLDLARSATTDTIQLEPTGSSGHRVVVDLFDSGSGREIPSGAVASQVARRPDSTPPIPRSEMPVRPLAQVDRRAAVLSAAATPPLAAGSGDGSGGSWLSNAKAKFDGTMATFDPIGNHVRKPIERAVPNLQFRGFIRQFSDFLVDRHGTVGFQQQDFRFLQLQNLAELETSYHVGTGLDVKGIAHMMYDGAYDWQDSTGLFADANDRTAEIYNTGERVLRELYVSYRRPTFDLKLGKQQVAWGKMDGQFIDIVNGMDRRESVQLESEDYEFRRLPTWMANSTFHFGSSTVQLLYIFDFEEDRQPLPGSAWYSPNLPTTTNNVVLQTKRPSTENFSDHEYGIRVDRAAGALTYGFIYMYAWDKNPVDQVLGTQVVNGDRVLTLQGEHERLHHVGATADYATTFQNVPWVGSLPTVFRVEALYTNGVRFADFEKRAQALAGSTTDGTSKRDTLRAAFATEFGLPGRTTAIIQASWYQTINHKEELGPGFGGGFGDEWSFIPVVFLSRPFAFSRDRLSMEATLFPLINGSDTGWGGIKSKLRLSYKVSQFIKANLLYTSYDTGDSNDLYGQYNKWDNFGWELSYEF